MEVKARWRTRLYAAALGLAALLLGACAAPPLERPDAVVSTLTQARHASPNFDARRPNYVILHHTTDETVDESLRTLTSPARGVSAHYLIGRDGRILALVDERHRAWHAGQSYWAGQRDINSASIGIELDNTGSEPFAEPQIVALLALLRDLQTRYKLPATSFLAHGDVAPGRKTDPSAFFPWRRLAQHGFGLWCDPPHAPAPPQLDDAFLLQAFGYNVWNLDAAIAAFKRRFAPEDPVRKMTENDRGMLYCMLQQMQALAVQEPGIGAATAAPVPSKPAD